MFSLGSFSYPSCWCAIPNDLTGENNQRLQTVLNTWRIFTDGSAIDGGVGGSIIVYDTEHNILRSNKFHLDPYCNTHQAESFSIWRALNYIDFHNIKDVHIYSESTSILQNILNINDNSYLTAQARELIWSMLKRNFKIRLMWLRGHRGILEIEVADECVQEAALAQLGTSSWYNYSMI